MVDRSLLDEFIQLDCTIGVRELLRQAISDGVNGIGPTFRQFDFDSFEVTVDVVHELVVVEDVLAPPEDEAGVLRVSLPEFIAALEGSAPRR